MRFILIGIFILGLCFSGILYSTRVDGAGEEERIDEGVTASAFVLPNPLCPPGSPNCTRSDIPGLLESIVNWLIEIGAIVVVGMVIWGAFQMMFAGGDSEKFKTGRNTIFYAVIGYAILLIGWGIASIVEQILTT